MKLNWAERWVVNNPLRAFQQRMEIGWFKRTMPLKPGKTILEIGCGRGAGAGLILRFFQPSQLHISDLDAVMVQKAAAFLAAAPTARLTMHVADSISLPFKSHTADAVFGFGFLHHVPDWRRALSEIGRVLKPGGTYYMEELYPELYQNALTKRILLHPEHDRFKSGDLRNALNAYGLRLTGAFELKKMGILGVAVKSPA